MWIVMAKRFVFQYWKLVLKSESDSAAKIYGKWKLLDFMYVWRKIKYNCFVIHWLSCEGFVCLASMQCSSVHVDR